MTTTRMIIVLRKELGIQQSKAQKEAERLIMLYHKLDEEHPHNWDEPAPEPVSRALEDWRREKQKAERLSKAAVALGSIQLGDIEDKEF